MRRLWRWSLARRMIGMLLALLVLGAGQGFLATPPPAGATHYRSMQLTWVRDATNTAKFTATLTVRYTYFLSQSPVPGDMVAIAPINFGDGTTEPAAGYVVKLVDVANDFIVAEKVVSHTYAGGSSHLAFIDDATGQRLSAPQHINNPDKRVRLETLVNFAAAGSPVSAITPIVDCPKNGLCTFAIPAVQTDSLPLRFVFATSEQMIVTTGGTQPPGATVHETTGVYSWDTTGATLNTADARGTYYSTQVRILALPLGSTDVNAPLATTAVDFFIRLTDTTANRPPHFHTPTDGAVYTVAVGTEATFTIEAGDDDPNDPVTVGIALMPTGATLTALPASGHEASSIFRWTPTVPGTTLLSLTATDSHSLGALPHTVTIVATGPTTLTAVGGDATVSPGTLTAQLLFGTTPVLGKTISFTFNALSYTATTGANGIATVTNVPVSGFMGSPTGAVAASFAGDSNYLASNATGDMLVVRTATVVTWATPTAIPYGTALTAVQLNASASVNGSPVAGTFSYNPALGTVLHAGARPLGVTFTPTDGFLYAGSTGAVTVQVTAVPLMVRPAGTRQFGDLVVPCDYATGSPVGLVNGDTAAALGTPVCTTTATGTSGLGRYPLQASGLASTDYSVTYEIGTLTIRARVVALALDPLPASVAPGARVTLTVRTPVTPAGIWPRGTVQFWVNGRQLASVQLINGVASYTITAPPTVGDYPIEVRFLSTDTRFVFGPPAQGTLVVR